MDVSILPNNFLKRDYNLYFLLRIFQTGKMQKNK